MNPKRHLVVVHDDTDFYLVKWYGDDLLKAQEEFSKGLLEPFYKFDFYKWEGF